MHRPVGPGQAWPAHPSDLDEAMDALSRLQDTGGSADERRGYRSAAMRGLEIRAQRHWRDSAVVCRIRWHWPE